MPKHIKVDGIDYILDELEIFYHRDNDTKEDLLVLGKYYSTLDFLNWNVEVIEEQTIDIEEIENDVMRDDWRYYVLLFFNKINELVRKYNELNREIKELKDKEKNI